MTPQPLLDELLYAHLSKRSKFNELLNHLLWNKSAAGEGFQRNAFQVWIDAAIPLYLEIKHLSVGEKPPCIRNLVVDSVLREINV